MSVESRSNAAAIPGVESRVSTPPAPKGIVLVVDDEPLLLRVYARNLRAAGYAVECASDGQEAAQILSRRRFDVIVSDLSMPGMDGIQLLKVVRQHDLDVPVVIVTGSPDVETAMRAIEYGALRYLVKPVDREALETVIGQAVQLHAIAKIKREALSLVGNLPGAFSDRASLESSFESALQSLWIAYQPIISWSGRKPFGYEALVRSAEPKLPHPGALFDAAERLGRLDELGRAIRKEAARPIEAMPGAYLFVNLHPRDLLDETLYLPDLPLSKIASRVVLEITERASLDAIKDTRERVATLRKMGFKIAVDDLGAGYSALDSLAKLEPEVVKLDMSLVRDLHREPKKQEIVKSLYDLSTKMKMLVVAEGIEVLDERDTLVSLGCDLLQGYLFAKPGRAFPPIANLGG